MESAEAPTLAPELLAMAQEYFHASSHRWWLVQGVNNEQWWYDLDHLDERVMMPLGALMITAPITRGPTTTGYLTSGGYGTVGLFRDGGFDGQVVSGFYPRVAVETETGDIFALGHASHHELSLLYVGPHQINLVSPLIDSLGHRLSIMPATLAQTADGRVALVYITNRAMGHALNISWTLNPSDAETIDTVEVSPALAELSGRGGFDLATAPDGANAIAVAWRPLTDPSIVEVNSARPPQAPIAAEVRIRVVSPDGPQGPVIRHENAARLPGPRSDEHTWEHTSNGMRWRLPVNGMKGTTLEGRAFFAWIDGDEVVGVGVEDQAESRIAPADGAPFIGFRGTSTRRELLLFDSSPRVRAFALTCD